MIFLTHRDGRSFALNPELIERIESMPDTMIVLRDGKRYLVLEPMKDVIERIMQYRRRLARGMDFETHS